MKHVFRLIVGVLITPGFVIGVALAFLIIGGIVGFGLVKTLTDRCR